MTFFEKTCSDLYIFYATFSLGSLIWRTQRGRISTWTFFRVPSFCERKTPINISYIRVVLLVLYTYKKIYYSRYAGGCEISIDFPEFTNAHAGRNKKMTGPPSPQWRVFYYSTVPLHYRTLLHKEFENSSP